MNRAFIGVHAQALEKDYEEVGIETAEADENGCDDEEY